MGGGEGLYQDQDGDAVNRLENQDENDPHVWYPLSSGLDFGAESTEPSQPRKGFMATSFWKGGPENYRPTASQGWNLAGCLQAGETATLIGEIVSLTTLPLNPLK